MYFMPKLRLLAILSSLGPQMDLIAYYDCTKCFLTLSHGERSHIINEACIINEIYAKNEIFGHFLEFRTLGRLDIEFNDITKCFLTFGYGIRSCTINKVCMNTMLYIKREPK